MFVAEFIKQPEILMTTFQYEIETCTYRIVEYNMKEQQQQQNTDRETSWKEQVVEKDCSLKVLFINLTVRSMQETETKAKFQNKVQRIKMI